MSNIIDFERFTDELQGIWKLRENLRSQHLTNLLALQLSKLL